jgi:hypothetical protein
MADQLLWRRVSLPWQNPISVTGHLAWHISDVRQLHKGQRLWAKQMEIKKFARPDGELKPVKADAQ